MNVKLRHVEGENWDNRFYFPLSLRIVEGNLEMAFCINPQILVDTIVSFHWLLNLILKDAWLSANASSFFSICMLKHHHSLEKTAEIS